MKLILSAVDQLTRRIKGEHMKKLIVILAILAMSSWTFADPNVPKNPWPPTDTVSIPMNLTGGYYTTTVSGLQTAITNASSGDTIYVKSESASTGIITLTTKTKLTIDGQGATLTLIDLAANTSIFDIVGGSDVTIKNFNLIGLDAGTYDSSHFHRGIRIGNGTASSRVKLENVHFSGFDSQGVYVVDTGGTNSVDGVTIDKCVFEDFQYDSGTDEQTGVLFGDSGQYSTVSNSRFANVPSAIRSTGANNTFKGNTITHTSNDNTGAPSATKGLIYTTPGTNSGKLLIDGNTINHNVGNIYPINIIGNSSTPKNSFTVVNNKLITNTELNDARTQIRGVNIDNATIANNQIRPTIGTYTEPAIQVIDSDDVYFFGNYINGGTYGINTNATNGETGSSILIGNSIINQTTAPTLEDGAGTGVSAKKVDIASGDFAINLTTTSESGPIRMTRHNATTAKSSAIQGRRSGGADELNPAIVSDDDRVFVFQGQGYDGSTWRNMAEFSFYIDGTPGASDMPGRIEFKTAPDGAIVAVPRLTIKNDGVVMYDPQDSSGTPQLGLTDGLKYFGYAISLTDDNEADSCTLGGSGTADCFILPVPISQGHLFVTGSGVHGEYTVDNVGAATSRGAAETNTAYTAAIADCANGVVCLFDDATTANALGIINQLGSTQTIQVQYWYD